jgi:hypothetical protein
MRVAVNSSGRPPTADIGESSRWQNEPQSTINRDQGSKPNSLSSSSKVPIQNSVSLSSATGAGPMDSTNFDVSTLGDLRDRAASTNLAPSTGSDAATANGPIRARMNEFANTMQAGNYPLALQQVGSTLEVLSAIRPSPERETIACANYFQALKILIRVNVLETELSRAARGSPDALRRVVELALLTMFLAELRSLLPRHSTAAKRMAVEKNVVAGNFGMAARWLRSLIQMAPATQKPALEQRLQMCVQTGELNAHMPPTKWLCYTTLTVIPQNPLKCEFCPAVYAPQASGVTQNQRCAVCRVGIVKMLSR